jgi:outer membrane protein OmpA-like peptidoglycan-associated protein
MPLGNQWTLSGRVGFIDYSGLLTTDEPTTVNVNGSATPGTIRHELEASLGSINIEPLIGYRITNRLTIHGGLSIGSVIQKSFKQTERTTEPTQGALTVPESVGDGNIVNINNLYAGLMGGVSFDIPLFSGSQWLLAPEVYYTHGLTEVVSDLEWSVNMLRAGLALKYSPSSIRLAEPPAGQKFRLVAGVQAFGMNSPDGAEEPIVRVRVEEFLTRTHKPLLPYIFFGNGLSEFPKKYHQLSSSDISSFNPERFNDSSLIGVYYDMLNIVGKRMKEKPASKITLTGCNSNEGSEKGNVALSQQRAENVKNYLTTVWGIEPNRIETKARNLPANLSNVNKEEGIAENRRVEIAASDPEIIAPLITRDTTRVANPPIIRFITQTESQAGVEAYSLAALQNSSLLQAFNGDGNPPQKIDWYLENIQAAMPRTDKPVQYNLRVTDQSAQDFTSPTNEIPIEQITIAKKRLERLGDKEIVRYTLMSFGYNQAEVEADNALFLNQVKEDIQPTSTVKIIGSTDTMGDEDFNRNLSEQRARSVAKILKPKNGEVRGVGEQTIFDNTLPEGRFYNRTVRVMIETPVNE